MLMKLDICGTPFICIDLNSHCVRSCPSYLVNFRRKCREELPREEDDNVDVRQRKLGHGRNDSAR